MNYIIYEYILSFFETIFLINSNPSAFIKPDSTPLCIDKFSIDLTDLGWGYFLISLLYILNALILWASWFVISTNNMKAICLIGARGGSKGVPGKNIKNVGGLPLISYTIKFSKELFKQFRPTIAISSDSNEIINIAKEYGLNNNGYDRPQHLASD